MNNFLVDKENYIELKTNLLEKIFDNFSLKLVDINYLGTKEDILIDFNSSTYTGNIDSLNNLKDILSNNLLIDFVVINYNNYQIELFLNKDVDII